MFEGLKVQFLCYFNDFSFRDHLLSKFESVRVTKVGHLTESVIINNK